MIKIVESRKDFGSMNGGSICSSNLTDEDKILLCDKYHICLGDLEQLNLSTVDKNEIFALHRKHFGEEMGFDGNHMFMVDQVNKNGSHFELTEDYVKANPKGWTDIPDDILVVTSKLPGIVIGHPVADCPVVMMADRKRGISAIGHCSAEMIDKHLPALITEVLRSGYGSRADDIIAYVGACIGEGWTYDSFPKWAKDAGVWDRCIYQGEDGLFHISLKPAIMEQLIRSGLSREQIVFNMDDTMTDSNYYSNSLASRKENPVPEKRGRHFSGMFFTDDGDMSVEICKGKNR